MLPTGHRRPATWLLRFQLAIFFHGLLDLRASRERREDGRMAEAGEKAKRGEGLKAN
jgi:hypothetical protein